MAFTRDRAEAAIAAIATGDELLLYATRGAFHSPTRDRGRVFGRAVATSEVSQLSFPVQLLGREFTHAFEFELESLAAPRGGVEIAELVPRLSSFPNKKGWAMRLRRPLLTLESKDARLIREALKTMEVGDLGDAVTRYLAEARAPLPAPRPPAESTDIVGRG